MVRVVVPKNDVDGLITAAAVGYDLDPLLIKAVIMQESGFKSGVMGFDGKSIGLMQITLPLAHDYFGRPVTFEDIKDDVTQINIGCWYLQKLMARYSGDLVKVLQAYNEGPGNVDKGRDDSVYSDSVLAYFKAYGGEV